MTSATTLFSAPLPPLARVDLTEQENVLVSAAIDALSCLGETVDITVDRLLARRVISESRTPGETFDRDGWIAHVRAAASSVGLAVSTASHAPADLVSGAVRRSLPLVGLAISNNEARVVTLLEVGHNRVRAEIAGKKEWLSLNALAQALGVDSPSSPLPWLFARPLAPLAPHSGDHHEHMSPVARARNLLRLERDDVWLTLLYAAAVGIVSLIVPVSVQALVSSVAFGGLLQPVVILALIVLVGLALAGGLTAAQSWVVERIQRRVFARVVLDLAHRLPRVRGEMLERAHAPELVNRFFDVFSVQKSLATLLVDGLAVLLATLVGMVILAFYHPVLLALVVFLTVGLSIIVFASSKNATNTAIDESKAKYAVAAWLEEMVRHPVAFKTAGGPTFASARAEDLLFQYLGARGAHFKIVFRKLTSALALQAIASSLLLGLGGALVIDGKLTLGQLVAAEIIVTSVVSRFSKFGKLLETTYDLLAAVDKLGHLVDLPQEERRGATLTRRPLGVALDVAGLGYTYEGREPVLSNVSFHVPAGRRTAILGRNASGKSTLLDVLYGLRANTSGRVLVDETDLRSIHPESWREHVVLVRDLEVFEGTVLENVDIGRPDVTNEDVRTALQTVDLWEDILALPNGLSTRLTTGAPELSKGQAHRLVLARALAGKPRLVLLDDALDQLDTKSRKETTHRLFDRKHPWTILVSTHDPEVMRAADDVMVLADGHLRPLRAEDTQSASTR